MLKLCSGPTLKNKDIQMEKIDLHWFAPLHIFPLQGADQKSEGLGWCPHGVGGE